MCKTAFACFIAAFCLLANAQIRPGDMPPDALGKNASGEAISLASMRNEVVVISFWATWCTYCMKELPILAGLQQLATQRHLPLQVVAIDHKEDRNVFLRTARLLKPRLPGLIMSWDRDGSIGKHFGAEQMIPVMVMLHRNGTVADVHVGYSEDELDGMLTQISGLLAEPSVLPVSSVTSAAAQAATAAN